MDLVLYTAVINTTWYIVSCLFILYKFTSFFSYMWGFLTFTTKVFRFSKTVLTKSFGYISNYWNYRGNTDQYEALLPYTNENEMETKYTTKTNTTIIDSISNLSILQFVKLKIRSFTFFRHLFPTKFGTNNLYRTELYGLELFDEAVYPPIESNLNAFKTQANTKTNTTSEGNAARAKTRTTSQASAASTKDTISNILNPDTSTNIQEHTKFQEIKTKADNINLFPDLPFLTDGKQRFDGFTTLHLGKVENDSNLLLDSTYIQDTHLDTLTHKYAPTRTIDAQTSAIIPGYQPAHDTLQSEDPLHQLQPHTSQNKTTQNFNVFARGSFYKPEQLVNNIFFST